MRLMTRRGDLLIYAEEMRICGFHLSHIRGISDYLCTSDACDIPREAIVSVTASFLSNLNLAICHSRRLAHRGRGNVTFPPISPRTRTQKHHVIVKFKKV